VLALVAASGVLAASSPATAQSTAQSAAASADRAGGGFAPPKIKHVWTIVLENKSYEASFTGLNKNSYLWQTLPSYGLLERQYYGTGHYSQDNYLSMVSGQGASPGPQNDCPLYNETGPVQEVADGQYKILNDTKKADGTYNDGSLQPGCVFPSQVQTLFNQFDAKGVSYKGYMQDMAADPAREPATCGNPAPAPGPAVPEPGAAEGPYAAPGSLAAPTATPDDAYVAKHNPFVWFHSTLDNGDCAKRVVPLEKNLLADLASEKTTPAYSFITPDNCSDAHDATCKGDNLSGGSNVLTGEKKTPANTQGGLYAADLFLEQVIPAIMKSPAYQDGGLIDVTFDEGFPPYAVYGNSIADKDYAPDAGLGTVTGATVPTNNGTSVQSQANTAQSVVACCNELPGPNTTQPGNQAFNQDTTPGGGITGSVLISPYITPGSVTDQPYNHFSYLRSIEDLFGITRGGSDGKGHLGYAGAEGLRPFGPDVYNNPRGKVLAPAASGTGGVYTAVASLPRTEQPVSHDPINGAP
jgi:hypothetical protein